MSNCRAGSRGKAGSEYVPGATIITGVFQLDVVYMSSDQLMVFTVWAPHISKPFGLNNSSLLIVKLLSLLSNAKPSISEDNPDLAGSGRRISYRPEIGS